jgi:nucleoside-diphosphate-sugar epimerase
VDLPSGWSKQPRRVLVTGGAGFLGSTLVDALVDAGHDVLVVDSFCDYYARERKLANLARVRGRENFRLLEGDVNDLDLVALLQDREICFHMAAQAGVRTSWGTDFDIYLAANIRATQRLLEACVEVRADGGALERMVFSSSSSVYGNQPSYPVTEDVQKLPHSPYGVTKLAAEQLCSLYAANFDVPVSSLRYFTVYGPRQRPDMAFQRFLEAAARGEPWMIFGDGSQTRDFTFVTDAVRANLLAADDLAPYAVYNIGGGSRVSLLDALAILRERAQAHGIARAIDVRHAETVKGDVHDTAADTARARDLLGFVPKVTLEAGLDAQAAWVAGEAARA